jgi:alpha-glucosidase (family GH31 glycosyl hydrolase)
MQEHIPQKYEFEAERYDGGIATHLSSSATDRYGLYHFSFEAVRPNLFRTAFYSDTHPLPPHPSVRRPVTNLQNVKTRQRHINPTNVQFSIGDVEVRLNISSCPTISLGFSGQPTLHEDLPHRSYVVDEAGISHYTRYVGNTLHVGLGEKAAPLDLSNRQFTLSATDCFGYDVYRTDPMYKHIPLLVNATPAGCIATFSTSHSRGHYSVGSEMDGLWGPYKVYRQDHGGLEEYLIIGHTLQEVVKTYADLVGYPKLVPRWAFGYLAGGMKYSMLDDPPAHQTLMGFADKLREHDIPCSGFQLSSGYTVSETVPKTRNVFTWNKHRFPDPKGWIDEYHKRGIRLIANVKPYVLANHPAYHKLAKAGAFFKKDGDTATARLWSAGGGESGIGGHIDFTSQSGWNWWVKGIQELAKLGIDCIWNDNNEYVISDDDWKLALESTASSSPRKQNRSIGLWGRAMQTELHAKASHDALAAFKPTERPFVLTRSATAGTMRYASSTWSGDNVTSWAGMKGSNALSINAGFNLLHCYGHDIGGFEGPQPSPELLLRWIQLGIHSPRFAINCYKTSPEDNSVGDVIEPWMYPEILPEVRKAIKRRYELIPFLYSLHLESHLFATPPIRWVGWGYEKDPEVWTEVLKDGETQYWLGDALMVGGVFEPGVEVGRVYLPKQKEEDAGFVNLNAPYQYLEAGQWVEIESKWKESIPILAKVGSAIPVGRGVQVLSSGDKRNDASLPKDDWRGIEIFPPKGSSNGRVFEMKWYEDDGISAATRIATYAIKYSCSSSEITVAFQREERAGFVSEFEDIDVILPVGDARTVVSQDSKLVKSLGKDSGGRCHFRLLEQGGRPVRPHL